jgi:hypothetical protein
MAVYVEKAWRHGLGFARVIGSVGIALAVVVGFVPSIATGLHHTMNMSMQMGGR